MSHEDIEYRLDKCMTALSGLAEPTVARELCDAAVLGSRGFLRQNRTRKQHSNKHQKTQRIQKRRNRSRK